ncbi:MAG: DMT family transporter [Sciscionella sp.]
MTAWLIAVAAASGSAALMAVATALQHRSATDAPDAQKMSGRQLAGFVRATLAHPLWLLALPADTLGFGLHALALHFGSLALVQPLLVSTLVFALPINHWLRRERITRGELGWAAAVVISLVGLLLLSRPRHGAPSAIDVRPAVVTAIVCGLVLLGAALLARSSSPKVAAALLGGAAGVAFAGVAALLKACTNVTAGGGIPALLTHWPLYALLAVGAVGLLLHQLGFQAGPLAWSLPAVTVADPLASVAIGIVVYDAPVRHAPLALAGQVLALAVLCAAGIMLSRRTKCHAG